MMVRDVMKRMIGNYLKNILYATLLGYSAISAEAKDRKVPHSESTLSLESIIKKGVSGNIGLTIVNVSNNSQTEVLKNIPPINDLEITPEVYSPFSQDNYEQLLGNGSTNEFLTGTERGDLAKKYSHNLATIVNFRVLHDTDGVSPTINFSGAGSGFFLTKEGHLITANHVVDDVGFQTYVLSFPNGGEPKWNPIQVLARSQKRDIALCKVKGNIPYNEVQSVSIKSTHTVLNDPLIGTFLEYRNADNIGKVEEGKMQIENKLITGALKDLSFFAAMENDKVSVFPDLEKSTPIILVWNGLIGNRFSQEHTLTPVHEKEILNGGAVTEYIVDIIGKAEQGNSGSALFDKNGNVSGVMSSGFNTSNEGGIISPQTIRDLIQQYQSVK